MKKLSLLLIFLLPLLFISCSSSKSTNSSTTKRTKKKPAKRGVYFENAATLTSVLEKAAASNKLVFVDFYTTWCTPCRMMDEDVFTDRGIADFMNKNFISYKVNAEKGNGVNLAYVFQVQAYPTLLFLDDQGQVLERKEGAAYQTELRRLANRALAKQN